MLNYKRQMPNTGSPGINNIIPKILIRIPVIVIRNLAFVIK